MKKGPPAGGPFFVLYDMWFHHVFHCALSPIAATLPGLTLLLLPSSR